MELVVKIVAPRHFADFLFKLGVLLLLCGALNHIRDVVSYGLTHANSYANNLADATWTALPMCTLALLLIKHLNTLQQRLYQQATTDPLTLIPNRRWFFDRCGAKISPGKALVLLDVDHFKNVNDTYGHDVGDTCLKTLSDHIAQHMPKDAAFARLGGEEFGLMFQSNSPDVLDRVQAICSGITVQVQPSERIALTVSAGVFEAAHDTKTQLAFRMADAALYDAKAAGRAQFAVAKSSHEQDHLANRMPLRAATA